MLIDFRKLFPKYNIKPNGILHIGANVGEEFPVYMELGIENQLWYEPNPDMFRLLIGTIRSNMKAWAVNKAVGNESKEIVLHISNNSGQSSSILELGTHTSAHPEVHYIGDINVDMVRIDEDFDRIDKLKTFQTWNLDFLNIDVQGYELNVLKGMDKVLNQFKWCYLEVNKEPLYIGCALVGEIDEYLAGFGFERVETKWAGNTGWGDALYIKQ